MLDLRIPQTKQYEQDVLDTAIAQYLAKELDEAGTEQAIADGWNAITDQVGKDKQLAAYVASLGVKRVASSDDDRGEPVPMGPAPRRAAVRRATETLGAWRSDGAARWLFIWPAVILILVLSIFPLVASLALSVSKLVFAPGGVDLDFIGLFNYQQLLFGLERSHFLGVLKPPNPLGWAILIGDGRAGRWRVDPGRPRRAGRARSGSSSGSSAASSCSASSACSSRRC